MISHESKYFSDSEKQSSRRVSYSKLNMTSDFGLEEHMEKYDLEHSAIHRKLQSKVEALKIMRNELEKYRSERDQFKLMAETLQMRYSAIKNSLNSPELQVAGLSHSSAVGLIVNQTRERNISLTTEVETLRQRVHELEGDTKVLRIKNADLQATCNRLKSSDEMKLNASGDSVWQVQKSKLISQMEGLKKKNAQLQYDIRSLLDEKEEVVMERDAYKCKAHRLNHELGIMLKGDKSQQKIIDVDSLIIENKYQQEKIANLENELELAKQSSAKYKTMLDTKRKKGIIKLGSNNGQRIMSHTQVKELLANGTVEELPLKAATISELKSLCLALLDNVNDKSLALTHQKKTNKLLAAKITELEQRIRMFTDTNEVASSCLSPSQTLLNGYTSATVDFDLSEEIIQLKASIRNDNGPEGENCNVEGTNSNTSQSLPIELFSSESNKSLPSDSEPGNRNYDHDSSSDFTSNTEETGDILLEPYINADRSELSDNKLSDLPPEIAELVRQLSESMDESTFSAN
ncbi:coiled-coil domain-containing protein 149 [Toxorhynchites rutilus septentrionalis]|uniref:coiled-coil domain-containing protein 149 n=1 Tax=Toxorhynchites rutilus septentrionalis TaxID=329112 RepID=UPI00247A50B1|nr:coiled-coil domain-containing protein 149 [Toxorhynchites rutilus septentrionalis]